MNNSVRIAIGVAVIVLGALIAITPRYLLPVCDFHEKEAAAGQQSPVAMVDMPCHDEEEEVTGAELSSGSMMMDNISDAAGGGAVAQNDMQMDSPTTMSSTTMDMNDDEMGTGTTTMPMNDMEMDMGESETGMAEMNNDSVPVQTHMQCYYTSRAAILLGLLVSLIGIAIIFATTRNAALMLALVLGGAGLAVILTPTWILPVCENQAMQCHKGAQQSLIVLGVLTVLAAGVLALLNMKGEKES